MRKTAVLIGCLGLTMAGCQKKPRAEFKVPAADATLKNPLGASFDAIAEGKKLYHGSDCAICHGKDGDGKGVLAKDISLNIHNWTDPEVQKRFSDGDLYYILENGKGMMPTYSKEETPDQIWEIIAYIRALGSPGPASSATGKSQGSGF